MDRERKEGKNWSMYSEIESKRARCCPTPVRNGSGDLNLLCNLMSRLALISGLSSQVVGGMVGDDWIEWKGETGRVDGDRLGRGR
jgi:hypothetical protein